MGLLGDKKNMLDEERSFTPAGGLQRGNNQQTIMESLTRVRALVSVGDASVNKHYLFLTSGNVHFAGRNRRQMSVTGTEVITGVMRARRETKWVR